MIEESQWLTPKNAPLPPRRDPTMYGVGLAATVTGGIAVPPCERSSDTMATVGAVMVVSWIVLLAVGIPMLVVGGKRVPKEMTAFVDPLTVRF